jgi:multidrug efflux pump subunit AcrA (membrane-fusion protein)
MTPPSTPTRPPAASLFDSPTAPRSSRRLALVVSGVAAVTVLLGVAAFAGVSAASNGSPAYRTATVSTQQVERSLTGVGTIRPVAQAAVAFPVSGTVATVDVVVGTEVLPGQVLATLDTTQLQTAVNTKQAAVDQANLTLQKVLNGETTGIGSGSSTRPSGSSSSGNSTGTGSSSTGSSGSSGSPGPGTGSSATTDPAALAEARKAVADAQHTLDTDLAAAEQALAAATTACGGTPPSTAPATSSTSTTSTTTPASPDPTTCQQALSAALRAQQQVATDQKALQDAINALEKLVVGSGGSSGPSTGTSTSSRTSTTSGSTATVTVSSSDIVAAQKAADAAEAQLAVAQQALASATIVSPMGGTVTAVSLAVGDSVSAGSTTATILVAGPGGYEVTTSVSVTDLPHVSLGQDATVVPDGSTTALAAKVVQIGLVPNPSSTTTTSYPVVLSLSDPATDLPDGGLATVKIVTGSLQAATAVPTSAVTTNSTSHTVVVLDGGKPKTVVVQVDTVGGTWTEITSGVEVGQAVVLADLSQALPGSATSGSTTATTRTGTGTGTGAGAGTGGFAPPAGFTPPGG